MIVPSSGSEVYKNCQNKVQVQKTFAGQNTSSFDRLCHSQHTESPNISEIRDHCQTRTVSHQQNHQQNAQHQQNHHQLVHPSSAVLIQIHQLRPSAP